MTTGEIISLIALCLSILVFISNFAFSYRKAENERDQERADNVQNIATIKNDISNINKSVLKLENKLDKIDEKTDSDHEKIIEHETRIKNIEKEVFKKGA